MQDLIERLKTDAGLNDEQAAKALEVIVNFVKEQFPMFAGAADQLFQGNKGQDFMP